MIENKKLKYVSIFLAIIVLFATWQFYEDIFAPNVSLEPNQESYIYIYSHDNFDSFLNRLEYQQSLKHINGFRRLAKLLSLDDHLHPGKYHIQSGMNNIGLVKLFKSGRQTTVNLVLKYADSKEQLAAFFASQLEPDSVQMLDMLNDSNYFNRIGWNEANILSLFVPNTYNFYWNSSPKEIVIRFQKEYAHYWNEKRIAQAKALQLTPIQVANLASIVQKESNKVAEMPKIARVYLNRLKLGMPLQADPTVIYAWHDKSIHRVKQIHIALTSPYNTYLNKGLPPGPICMPHPTVIDAVLNAPESKEIYFCAKADLSGYHNFASNLLDHQRNARLYQKKLNESGIN